MSSLIASKPLVKDTSLAEIPDVMVSLSHVSVRYQVPRERIGTFKEYIIRKLQGKVGHNTFWALHDVSLNIQKGEVFGLVGQNGAGKSTLLKLIARVLLPIQGRVQVKGRVAPLLEVGAGFHPELTGRENIFLNGAILGFNRKDIEDMLPNIIAFSELGDFIEAPMRTYSSGMWARLGFSVATEVMPDILIVDEVLGVGDEAFQRKCARRIQSFRENGSTILLVSHNTDLVLSMCQQAAWLDHGNLQVVGPVDDVIKAYRQSQH